MDFLEQLSKRVLVADGAMGTRIQSYAPTPADFDGLEGCNEILVLTKPELIRTIHRDYLAAGADYIKTNTFGASGLVLGEYGIADKSREIGRRAAELARGEVARLPAPTERRFVAGSVGPGTKLATLGATDFDEMRSSYLPLMLGLIEGGVDLIQIETCQDLLQLKCAVITAREAMEELRRRVPLCVTITIEMTGTMLIGSDVPAALAVLEGLEVDILGLNCATGPDLMADSVRQFCELSSRPVAVLPNAGLPENIGGRAVYNLSPADFAGPLLGFVEEYGVSLVGGCCGTSPDHIALLKRRLQGVRPKARSGRWKEQVSSTFTAVALDQEGTSPLLIGERCNANGSKLFRELLLAEKWDEIVEMGRSEAAGGAHVLDVCTAYAGRNEARDMGQVLRRFASRVPAPLMLDSTQVDVLEAGLKLVGGRAIINSINLEDGEEKLDKICLLAKRFGAALVALCIDEEGMARDRQRKLAVAKRIFDICITRHALTPGSLLFDPLTFTIASGDEESRRAAVETLEAITEIKRQLPGVRTMLGLSNVSFGLKPAGRQILNSVFLSEALKAGLDAAILNAAKIVPMNSIGAGLREVALDLIYDRRRAGYDPLFKFIELTQAAKPAEEGERPESGPLEELLKQRIISGRKSGIEELLKRALESYQPLEIINKILLAGMQVVGELFGKGELQLPFVLQSAETMKKAVGYLEQFMDKSAGPVRGSIVLATVRGDVHDIGKNLVDIILSNNGYRVFNLTITTSHRPAS